MNESGRGVRAVRFFDGGELREGTLTSDAGALTLVAEQAPDGAPALDGIVTGLFTDHHVHLQLVDHTLLAESLLGTVVDLGAEIGWISDVSEDAAHPRVRYAGPFLTAVGGYPSDRAWAPAGAVVQIADASQAATVVAELAARGVSFLKVVGNSDAGPVLDDDLMRALAHLAAEHRLPLVAHAEGAAQAQRVVRLGATRLAHSPFSERLTDAEIADQAASASWISTMAIHDGEAREIVTDNVRRFFAAGGELVYGSDMGNGPTPVDLREAEVDALRAAGVDGRELLNCLAPADPTAPGASLLLLPDGDPNRARRFTATDLELT